MAYSIRHQIFLSSTYTDLKEERAEVLQAIWELDCIPTGMESFVASNESQWDVIRRVIDECDYYVLVIGGRYGSMTDEGISFTEKEYDYAKKIGLPVLAFVHADPDQIPVGKSEKDEPGRQKLNLFRKRVMDAHPVGLWTNAKELGGLVSRSLVREIKINPRPGWIRNDGASPIKLLEQINTLTQENLALRDAAISMPDESDNEFQGGEDIYELYGIRRVSDPKRGIIQDFWDHKTSWDAIFVDIGPALINEATSSDIATILSRFQLLATPELGTTVIGNEEVEPECFNEVIIQFRALGLIDKGHKKRGVNDRNSYWSITPKGDRHLVNILAKRRTL
jgi:hypothetical protein